jgi:hypothetical protein
MDVAHQFEKIWFLFTEKGLVAVLVQMAVTPVALVELLGIPDEQSSHYGR